MPFQREEGKKHLIKYFTTIDKSVESYFANINSPAQMTITARTVSKFRASTRSECPEIFFLDLKSLAISGIIEPWSECQPKVSTLRFVFNDYHQKVVIWLGVFVKSSNFTRCC